MAQVRLINDVCTATIHSYKLLDSLHSALLQLIGELPKTVLLSTNVPSPSSRAHWLSLYLFTLEYVLISLIPAYSPTCTGGAATSRKEGKGIERKTLFDWKVSCRQFNLTFPSKPTPVGRTLVRMPSLVNSACLMIILPVALYLGEYRT